MGFFDAKQHTAEFAKYTRRETSAPDSYSLSGTAFD